MKLNRKVPVKCLPNNQTDQWHRDLKMSLQQFNLWIKNKNLMRNQ